MHGEISRDFQQERCNGKLVINMLITKVKICGITNYKDAIAALDMGADLLGFNFYPESPRFISPEKAVQIINKLPAFIDLVGIFVNASIDQIHETKNFCQLDWIQLHGDENPQFCKELLSHNVKVMKALRVKDHNDIKQVDDYFTDAILLDAFILKDMVVPVRPSTGTLSGILASVFS